MKHWIVIMLCSLLAAGCATPAKDPANQSVRIRFVPGSVPGSPLESSSGAVWSRLSPWPQGKDTRLKLEGWAAIGDKFPVAKKDGPTLFEIRLADGDDKRLNLDLLYEGGPKRLNLKRDKPEKVLIGGSEFTITYPSVEAAAKDGRTTTNKAMVVVSTPGP